MSNTAFIYDAIRTPRGKGKNTGSLHELSPVKLASKTLKKIKERKKIAKLKIKDLDNSKKSINKVNKKD